MAQWKQRQLVPLKPGEQAYFFSGWKDNWSNWGKPDLVTITGECDEGDGYTAHSPAFAAEHPEHPEDERGCIHTCNGFLCKTRREARAKSLEIARGMRKKYAEQQAHVTQVVQYLDWIISRGGKH